MSVALRGSGGEAQETYLARGRSGAQASAAPAARRRRVRSRRAASVHDDGDAGLGETGRQLRRLADRRAAGRNFYFHGLQCRGRASLGDVVNNTSAGAANNDGCRMRSRSSRSTRAKQADPRTALAGDHREADYSHRLHAWDGVLARRDSSHSTVPAARPLPHSHAVPLRRRRRSGRLRDRTPPRYIEGLPVIRRSPSSSSTSRSGWRTRPSSPTSSCPPALRSSAGDIAEIAPTAAAASTTAQTQLNHRIVVMQHKAHRALGEVEV